MAKLTISKPVEKTVKDTNLDLNQLLKLSAYQVEVPGVGRLRTSERHPDFHLQNIDRTPKPKTPAKSERAKELT